MNAIKLLVTSLTLLLSACAVAGPKAVWHSFVADGIRDNWSQDIELLEYRYENGQAHMGRKAAEGIPVGSKVSINGDMPVAESLYLKWKLKRTGVAHEKTVDLRPLLPGDMFNHKITFVIDQDQVYIYLVTPRGKSVGEPPVLKTNLSRFYVTHEIYPRNSRP